MSKFTETIDLSQVGVIEQPLDETIDHKGGKKPPLPPSYHFRVDKQNLTTEKPVMTGREILILAGKNPPERFLLFLKMSAGQKKKIGLDEKVGFTQPGVEQFRTYPLDQTEG